MADALNSANISAVHCPLCGQANSCAAEMEKLTGDAQPPCWCMTTKFDLATLEKLPEGARDKACICQKCAMRQQALVGS